MALALLVLGRPLTPHAGAPRRLASAQGCFALRWRDARLENELKPLLRFCKAGVKLFGGTEESTTSAQQAMGASFVEDMGTVARIYLSIAPGSALCCRFGHYCFQIQVDRNKQAILVEQVIPDEVSVALMEAVGRCEAVLEQHGWLPRDCLRIPTAKEEEQTGPGI